jgi:phosphoglycolate phosphatase
MPRLPLILFDIDGTLLAAGDATHARSITAACQELFGVAGDPRRADLAGRTDRYILQNVLASYGIAPEESAPRLPEAFAFMEDYVARELPDSLAERVLPGVPALLAALQAHDLALGLVTGNLRRIAQAKLDRAGIWAPFAHEGGGIGGYGDASIERADLPPVALAAAEQALGQPVPAAQVVIVGDTPHDIACGQACAARTVAVATGRFSAAALQACGPDLVLDDLTGADRFIEFVLADGYGPPRPPMLGGTAASAGMPVVAARRRGRG